MGRIIGTESWKPLSPPGCQSISQRTDKASGTRAGSLQRHSLSPPDDSPLRAEEDIGTLASRRAGHLPLEMLPCSLVTPTSP